MHEKQVKWGKGTLNIALLKTKMLFNSSPNKIDFWLFLHFWPCQGSLSAIGAKNSLLNGQIATYGKSKVSIGYYPKLRQDMGEIWSNWVGSIWAPKRGHLVFFPSTFRHHCVPFPLLSINCDHYWSLITRIQSSETKQTHCINLHFGQWPCLSETAAQPVFFGPKSPSSLSDFIWRREKLFSFFLRQPFPKAWVENEDCNAMADNLTQCGLGKEARPVRLNFDTSSFEKSLVIFS